MTDKIYLLSVGEYEKYRNRIPHTACWWWLRSPGYNSNCASVVIYGGSVDYGGLCVRGDCFAVRPALKIESSNLQIGERVVIADFPFVIIDKGLAIAEVPIGFHRFDRTSNNYEESEVRQFILDWFSERSGNA